jgi:hypothetical protein
MTKEFGDANCCKSKLWEENEFEFTVSGTRKKRVLEYLQTWQTMFKTAAFPIEWEQKLKMIEDDFMNERFILTVNCQEYIDINDIYKKTSGRGNIQRIERIQNVALWRRFHG